jgi:hypothetical protein
MSVSVSVHIKAHIMLGGRHPATQLDARQLCPIGHMKPHVPQLLGSLVVSTHVLLHELSAPGHGEHMPPEQISVPLHVCPHEPQFAGSEELMHIEAQ